MGSERVEMGKRPQQDTGNAGHTRITSSNSHMLDSVNTHTLGWLNAPPNACCFCWCCCCSCSCLTARPFKDERIPEGIREKQTEAEAEVEELRGPTLEDVHLWAQTFEQLIKSPHGRASFRQFLKTEFSEENLLFWLACEELKKETNRTVVEQTVKQIYEDYVSILSPREVSLDSRVREVINKNMLEPTSHTFDDAQQQIYTLMQRDSYPRFINSSVYADLIKGLEEPQTPNES
ncbi:regulator of G-protein signaling 20 [Pygocentrus nattereri]|uniref:RGS domain-containing protein n=1 Tax=Pygocentrus nattereri TaxID=42514 RepID=A0A3B4EAT9_PYGNA|nr:regulator of G-protein signaling 20 [Pygocentrus nattereri]XP_017567913.1 regulator of G-protein signaling 20 [Pygocentrus nattereri]XP_037391662.1 regulator of G-protein signaling 20 [Pygocentrus nattereri]